MCHQHIIFDPKSFKYKFEGIQCLSGQMRGQFCPGFSNREHRYQHYGGIKFPLCPKGERSLHQFLFPPKEAEGESENADGAGTGSEDVDRPTKGKRKGERDSGCCMC
jgi:hypothetical protein